mgnify:CR=1 FL=1
MSSPDIVPTPSSTVPTPTPLPEIELITINPCAKWTWNISATNCGLCCTKLTVHPTLESNGTMVDDNVFRLKVTYGECTHAFHEKCATKWFKSCSVCPVCNVPFVPANNKINDPSKLEGELMLKYIKDMGIKPMIPTINEIMDIDDELPELVD